MGNSPLCAACAKHRPDAKNNCRIAVAIDRIFEKFGAAAPIQDCPQYVPLEAMCAVTLRSRILSLVSPVPNSGCWLWMGSVNLEGYGMLHANGRRSPAHRLAYEEFKGPIPSGMTIDHLCRVRCCVNPNHLEAVSNAENARRAAVLQQRRPCKRGHLPTPENTYCRKGNRNGHGDCLECRRIRKREARATGKR